MATTSQGISGGLDHGISLPTPRVTYLKTDLPSLIGADRQQVAAFERGLYSPCPRDFARSVARELSTRPGSDSESRLEGALREFSTLVIQEIVRQVDRHNYAATVAEVFTCGKEVMTSGDALIQRAKAKFCRGAVAA
jgi:hypothetical protein